MPLPPWLPLPPWPASNPFAVVLAFLLPTSGRCDLMASFPSLLFFRCCSRRILAAATASLGSALPSLPAFCCPMRLPFPLPLFSPLLSLCSCSRCCICSRCLCAPAFIALQGRRNMLPTSLVCVSVRLCMWVFGAIGSNVASTLCVQGPGAAGLAAERPRIPIPPRSRGTSILMGHPWPWPVAIRTPSAQI